MYYSPGSSWSFSSLAVCSTTTHNTINSWGAGCSNNAVGWVLALHVTDQGSITGIPYGPLSTRVILLTSSSLLSFLLKKKQFARSNAHWHHSFYFGLVRGRMEGGKSNSVPFSLLLCLSKIISFNKTLSPTPPKKTLERGETGSLILFKNSGQLCKVCFCFLFYFTHSPRYVYYIYSTLFTSTRIFFKIKQFQHFTAFCNYHAKVIWFLQLQSKWPYIFVLSLKELSKANYGTIIHL